MLGEGVGGIHLLAERSNRVVVRAPVNLPFTFRAFIAKLCRRSVASFPSRIGSRRRHVPWPLFESNRLVLPKITYGH